MKHPALFAIALLLFISAKGQRGKIIGITGSFPWINNYAYFDYGLNKSQQKSGFAGIGAAIFYKINKDKVSLNVGFTNDIPAPFGAFDYDNEIPRTNINSSFIEFLYHKKLITH